MGRDTGGHMASWLMKEMLDARLVVAGCTLTFKGSRLVDGFKVVARCALDTLIYIIYSNFKQ